MNKKLANDKFILLILFACVQLFLLLTVGIYTKEEATKYISEAAYFSGHHAFTQPKYFFYSGYILIHVINNWLGSGIVGVYLFQVILSGVATICLYSLSVNIGLERRVAFLTCLLLIFCLPFQKWTVYLFTESIFFSLLIIYTSIFFSRILSAPAKIYLGLLFCCLLIISRPTGLLVIPASLVLVSVALIRKKMFAYLALIWIPGIIGLLWITNMAMKGEGEFDFIKPFVEEHVICGYSSSGISYQPASNNSNSLQGLVSYILQHFSQFAALASKRAVAFFGLIRPYFSMRHNLFLAVYFYPIYLFFLLGIPIVYRKSPSFVYYSLALMATFLLSVLVTCDDWHNRFIMPVVPLIMVYASAGIYYVYDRLISRRRSK